MSAPERIRLSRNAGWRKPENTIVVSRPSKWGNPYKLGGGHESAVEQFEMLVTNPELALKHANCHPVPTLAEIRAELAGKNLACWCPLDKPCHADVLLRLANGCDCSTDSHHPCDLCDGVWCPERGCCDGPGMHQSPHAPDESKEGRET